MMSYLNLSIESQPSLVYRKLNSSLRLSHSITSFTPSLHHLFDHIVLHVSGATKVRGLIIAWDLSTFSLCSSTQSCYSVPATVSLVDKSIFTCMNVYAPYIHYDKSIFCPS